MTLAGCTRRILMSKLRSAWPDAGRDDVGRMHKTFLVNKWRSVRLVEYCCSLVGCRPVFPRPGDPWLLLRRPVRPVECGDFPQSHALVWPTGDHERSFRREIEGHNGFRVKLKFNRTKWLGWRAEPLCSESVKRNINGSSLITMMTATRSYGGSLPLRRRSTTRSFTISRESG